MKFEDKDISKLERYLTQEMSDDKCKLFEKEINAKPELNEFVSLYKQLDELGDEKQWSFYNRNKTKQLTETLKLFQQNDVKTFSNKLKAVKKEQARNVSVFKNIILKRIIIATVAACLFVFVYLASFSKQSLSKIYLNYKNQTELPSFIVRGETINKKKVKIEQLYDAKKYNQVIILCDSLLAFETPIDPNILIFKGLSQMAVNQHDEALKTFSSLIQNKNLIDFHKGYWYMALLYLKNNEKNNAIKTLKIIADNNTFYHHQDAIKILKKLND